jgi:hypothetical protein
MRINARLDDDAQRQLDELTQATGQSVSHIVREAVARYHREVTTGQRGLQHFAKLVGTGDSGRSDLASNYKDLITESLVAKHGLGPA